MTARAARPARPAVRVALLSLPAAVALVFAACRREPPPPAAPPPASVVLLLIDTLRADHLGAYGYPRPTSPTIDRLAAESLVFRHARSVAPWTNPTIASLFADRRPSALFAPSPHQEAIGKSLPADLPVLAEKLHAQGVRTAALVDHPGMSPRLGFARGFDSYVRLYEAGNFPTWGVTDGAFVVAQLEEQLTALDGARFFLYLHVVYPHRPYQAPPPYDGMFGETTRGYSRRMRAQMINAYDAEIRFTDDVVAELLATLARHRRLDDSWIVLTSDHGEGFYEHGRGEHGNSLFDELLHVPLIVRPPRGAGIAPRAIEAPVSLLDLHATVLEAATGQRPPAADGGGRSLLRWLGRRDAGEPDDVVSQHPHSGDVDGTALVRGAWKLIRRDEENAPPLRLYDLATDAGEQADLAAAQPETARRLERALLRHLAHDERARATLGERADRTLDDDEIARLRALGYLQ